MVINYILLFFSTLSFWGDNSSSNYFVNEQSFADFKQLLVEIRNQKYSPDEARSRFKIIIKVIRDEYGINGFDTTDVNLVFPLRTKNYLSVGGTNGSGYHAKYFDLFDFSVNKSHPAHDIFIFDVNQDCIDDRDKDYVDVLAASKGVVIATELDWKDDSEYRGGNYIWMLDFKTGGLWYYAHQRKVYVEPGQIVKQGEIIGQVGRTGFNAKAKRSDTHLHLMFLSITEDNLPSPYNYFKWLKKAKTVFDKQYPDPIAYKSYVINKIKSISGVHIQTNLEKSKKRQIP